MESSWIQNPFEGVKECFQKVISENAGKSISEVK